jgi:hypothetical protein
VSARARTAADPAPVHPCHMHSTGTADARSEAGATAASVLAVKSTVAGSIYALNESSATPTRSPLSVALPTSRACCCCCCC